MQLIGFIMGCYSLTQLNNLSWLFEYQLNGINKQLQIIIQNDRIANRNNRIHEKTEALSVSVLQRLIEYKEEKKIMAIVINSERTRS